VSNSKQGAPGEEPAAAPVASGGASKESAGDAPAGDAQPKRRRGSRGGRRHKKPAAAAAANDQVQTKPAPAEAETTRPAQGSSPRDGYAAPAGALSDLPTAPLIPAAGRAS